MNEISMLSPSSSPRLLGICSMFTMLSGGSPRADSASSASLAGHDNIWTLTAGHVLHLMRHIRIGCTYSHE